MPIALVPRAHIVHMTINDDEQFVVVVGSCCGEHAKEAAEIVAHGNFPDAKIEVHGAKRADATIIGVLENEGALLPNIPHDKSRLN